MHSTGYIVLAEDNPADAYLVQRALDEGEVAHSLRIFSDGEETIRFFETLEADSSVPCPSLLLLDLHLPKLDGFEILKHLSGSHRCGRTPVVVFTSSDSTRKVEAVTQHPALHYFRKSADLDQFMKLGDVVKEIIAPASRRAEGN